MTEENENIEKTTEETPVAETPEAAAEPTDEMSEAPPAPESVEEPAVEAEAAADEPAAEEAVAEEPAAEEPAAEPEAAVDETPAEEPVADEPAAEVEESSAAEAPAEEAPAAEAPVEDARSDETPADEVPADEAPSAEEAPAEEAPAEDAAPAEAPAAEHVPAAAPQSEPKKKGKRLPRRLRPQKTRPTRAAATGERKPLVRLPKPEHERGRRQERRGVVVSNAMDKTIVVKVDVITSHQKYKKVIRRSVKFHAHDEQNAANVGDVVRIVETKPLSKTKHWRLAEIVEAAK